ncbi:MAG: GNAT family N-acetyltransferase [Actinobacteria bacterium]|nr:GNAT family N-acetyltransferase [Actinomycetota bacterium]
MSTRETAVRIRQLPDGAVIRLRELHEGDEEALRRLFFRLSPATVRLRFFQPVETPSPRVLHYLADVDHDRRQAIAAVVDDEVVGVARYDRFRDAPDRAEVAVVVEDAWQGRGVGTMLLNALARDARDHGVASLTATVMGENRRMLSVARRLAPDTRVHLDHGEWAMETPLADA